MRARCRASRRTADSRAATSASAARPASSPRASPSREEAPPSSTGRPASEGVPGPRTRRAAPPRRRAGAALPASPAPQPACARCLPSRRPGGPASDRCSGGSTVAGRSAPSGLAATTVRDAVSDRESVRPSMTESLPSPDSTLRSRRTVRPGWRSSSSSRPGQGDADLLHHRPGQLGLERQGDFSQLARSQRHLGISGPSKAKRPGDSPSRPILPEESDRYFLFDVFLFALPRSWLLLRGLPLLRRHQSIPPG